MEPAPINDADKREDYQHDEAAALKYLKTSKIYLPILIGIGVVIWMLTRQFDITVLRDLHSTGHVIFWIGMAVLMYIARHLFYSMRLRVVTDYAFSWLKAIQLIVIWEFSTAVSPTSVGGAGVAFFMLSKEKLGGAKTITAVLYTMIADTVFITVALIVLYLIVGPVMIRPGMVDLSDIDGYGITFLIVLTFMIGYGSLFFYGLFIRPRAIKRLLFWVSKWKIVGKFKKTLRTTAYDIETAAAEIKHKPISFHLKAMGCTMGAWSVRFLAINFLIVAFTVGSIQDLYDHLIVFARGMAMYTIEAFSPTPGASGVAEVLFSGFYSDYVTAGVSVMIVFLWRLIGYYSYLFAGAIVVPLWLRSVFNKKEKTT
ncbi:MAG: flippase-like domain-containing protein [Saprospiraceae bacterium]|nr:MAG: integral membrane protein [Bacteroidetes bacterium OLB9]MCO6463360.1 flippase-like domain-containing protein [Saprospiraceae bacterium]